MNPLEKFGAEVTLAAALLSGSAGCGAGKPPVQEVTVEAPIDEQEEEVMPDKPRPLTDIEEIRKWMQALAKIDTAHCKTENPNRDFTVGHFFDKNRLYHTTFEQLFHVVCGEIDLKGLKVCIDPTVRHHATGPETEGCTVVSINVFNTFNASNLQTPITFACVDVQEKNDPTHLETWHKFPNPITDCKDSIGIIFRDGRYSYNPRSGTVKIIHRPENKTKKR